MAARSKAHTADRVLLLATLLLLALGLVMIFSASFVTAAEKTGDAYYYLKKQALWVGLGLAGMYLCSRIHYTKLKKMSLVILIINFVLLGLIFTGLGTDLGTEAKRWLALGPVVLQPSEFSKLAFIIFTAAYMSSRRIHAGNIWMATMLTLGIASAALVMIAMQPDFGTSLIVFAGTAIIVFIAGVPVLRALSLSVVGIPPLVYLMAKEDYRLQRIFVFIDPWVDPLNKGYQAIQSLYALGSGHIFGSGLGRGRQKLFYLPAPQNDYIFAVIGEELGFIGAAAILLLYLVFAWRGFQIALRAPDLFGSLLAAGITFSIVFQVLVNVAVVTASVPTTGVNLPLISAGGSSVFFTLISIGFLLNISRYGQQKKTA